MNDLRGRGVDVPTTGLPCLPAEDCAERVCSFKAALTTCSHNPLSILVCLDGQTGAWIYLAH